MKQPSPSTIQQRARNLVESMQRAEHWIYAVPTPESLAPISKLLESMGLSVSSTDGELSSGIGASRLSVRLDDQLELCWLEARGLERVPAVAEILKITGFFAHTELFAAVADPEQEGAHHALITLLGMCVEWDGVWTEMVADHWAGAEAERDAIRDAMKRAEARGVDVGTAWTALGV